MIVQLNGLDNVGEMGFSLKPPKAVRKVVKKALQLNAGAVVLSHNHPSGQCEPSRADEFLTHNLKSALALVDVRVLDHIIVSNSGALSFAERGLL